jgi:hypothetical protein
MQTYPNYSDFPSDWRDQKRSDAEIISRFISKDANLLSFGCGIGYLESCLMESIGQTFHVTDFSPYILNYRPDLKSKFIAIDDLSNTRFSQILLNQVTYSLNECDLRELLNQLHNCLEIRGTLIIGFTEPSSSFRAWTSHILTRFFPKNFSAYLESIRNNLSKRSQVTKSQGWGYHRSNSEMIDISVEMGFEVMNFSRSSSQS